MCDTQTEESPNVTEFIVVPKSVKQEIDSNTSIIQNLFQMFGINSDTKHLNDSEENSEDNNSKEDSSKDNSKKDDNSKDDNSKEDNSEENNSEENNSEEDSEEEDFSDVETDDEDEKDIDHNKKEENETDIFLIGTTNSSIQYESSFEKAREALYTIMQQFVFNRPSSIFRINKKKYKIIVYERDPYYIMNPYEEHIAFMGEIIRVSKFNEKDFSTIPSTNTI